MVRPSLQITCILLIDGRNYSKTFKRYYLRNREHFLQFLLYFRILDEILLTLRKNISFIAKLFQKLLTLTNVVTSMLLSSCFRTAFASKRLRGCHTFLENVLKHFHPIFALIYGKLSWKTSPLVRSEILRMFGNTLTADHMYSRHRWEKLPQKVQTLLSKKRKTFFAIFIAISKSTKNFAHL